MNEATLQRLQQRMQQEGYKEPSEPSMEDDPATAGDCDTMTQQQRTIYTEPTQSTSQTQEETESERYARQVQRQHELLAQFEQQRNTSTDVDALASELQAAALNKEGDSPVSSLGEELWTCGGCGLDSPDEHHYCGVCGTAKPENWWCHCGIENSPYHRFCVRCGSEEDLGYEEDLDAEEQARIEATAAAIPTISVPQHKQDWDDVDDELTFAQESVDGGAHQARHSQTHAPQGPQQEAIKEDSNSDIWTCGVCTFLNQNPLFMCCEMCGSARPAAPGSEVEEALKLSAPSTHTKKTAPRSTRDDSSDDTTNSKQKEKTYSALIREQQKNFYREQQQAQGQPGSAGNLPEPETDHELAMIYAQQERILAQYQQQLNSSS